MLTDLKADVLKSFIINNDPTPQEILRTISAMDSAPVVDDNKTVLQALQAGFAQMTAALTGKSKKGLDSEESDKDEKKKKEGEDSDEDDEKDKRLKAAEDSIKELKAALDAAKKGRDADDDDLEKMLDGDEKKGEDADGDENGEKEKKAADAAMRSVVVALKPTLAAMPEKHRKAAADALRPLITGIKSSDKEYAQVSEAAKAAKAALDAAGKPGPIDLKQVAADIAKEWDARL